jgi:hypothetical protein
VIGFCRTGQGKGKTLGAGITEQRFSCLRQPVTAKTVTVKGSQQPLRLKRLDDFTFVAVTARKSVQLVCRKLTANGG